MVNGRVVYITGAASGIGLQVGVEFLKNGAKVVFTDVNEEKVKEVTMDLKKEGYDCIGLKVDVTKEQEIIDSIDVKWTPSSRQLFYKFKVH